MSDPMTPERITEIRERAGLAVEQLTGDGSSTEFCVQAMPYLLAEVERLRAERDRLANERDGLAQQISAVKQARVWKNEDGKSFVFADDLRAALAAIDAGHPLTTRTDHAPSSRGQHAAPPRTSRVTGALRKVGLIHDEQDGDADE